VVLAWPKHWAYGVAFAGVGLAVVTPWLYRNALVFGAATPLTSNFWRDAYFGNGPGAAGELRVRPGSGLPDAAAYQTRADLLAPPEYDRLKRPEPQRVAWMRGQTVAWVRANPLAYAGLCVKRAAMTVGVWPYAYSVPIGRAAAFALPLRAAEAGGLIALGVCGRRGPGRRCIFAMTAALLVIPGLCLAEIRQSVLLDVPLLSAWSLSFGTPRGPQGGA
jgi:hypothetical protein